MRVNWWVACLTPHGVNWSSVWHAEGISFTHEIFTTTVEPKYDKDKVFNIVVTKSIIWKTKTSGSSCFHRNTTRLHYWVSSAPVSTEILQDCTTEFHQLQFPHKYYKTALLSFISSSFHINTTRLHYRVSSAPVSTEILQDCTTEFHQIQFPQKYYKTALQSFISSSFHRNTTRLHYRVSSAPVSTEILQDCTTEFRQLHIHTSYHMLQIRNSIY
jgi:uncharacterized membrane protein YbaN (DUF454 family)